MLYYSYSKEKEKSKMNFPKSVLVIKYYVPEKGTPIGITSFEIAKKFF